MLTDILVALGIKKGEQAALEYASEAFNKPLQEAVVVSDTDYDWPHSTEDDFDPSDYDDSCIDWMKIFCCSAIDRFIVAAVDLQQLVHQLSAASGKLGYLGVNSPLRTDVEEPYFTQIFADIVEMTKDMKDAMTEIEEEIAEIESIAQDLGVADCFNRLDPSAPLHLSFSFNNLDAVIRAANECSGDDELLELFLPGVFSEVSDE